MFHPDGPSSLPTTIGLTYLGIMVLLFLLVKVFGVQSFLPFDLLMIYGTSDDLATRQAQPPHTSSRSSPTRIQAIGVDLDAFYRT